MTAAAPDRLEILLAGMLRQGTRVATAAIVAGLAAWRSSAGVGKTLVDLGLALFILLPVARVFVMMAIFARARDARFAALSACVLAIIAAGALVAMR